MIAGERSWKQRLGTGGQDPNGTAESEGKK
jgi:hypothetical protein